MLIKRLKKIIAFTLTAALTLQIFPASAFAALEKPLVMLQQETMPDEILHDDLFYIGSLGQDIPADSGTVYLLKIGRGGDAERSAEVTLKMTDVTAKYGTDYKIREHNGRAKVTVPEDNLSLLEMMTSNEHELIEYELGDDDQFLEDLVETGFFDEELEEMGLMPEATPSSLSDEEQEKPFYLGEASFDGEGEYEFRPGQEAVLEYEQPRLKSKLAAARELYTGLADDREPMTVDGETQARLEAQTEADALVEEIVGATLTLSFAPGETEKFVEIEPFDNQQGDKLIFMMTLTAPKGATNSLFSSIAMNLVNSGETELATLTFGEPEITENVAGEKIARVPVYREGAVSAMVAANVTTQGLGDAFIGQDFSYVDAQLTFPFGVTRRSIDIPINPYNYFYEKQFTVTLSDFVGAEATGGESLTVTIPVSDTPELQAARSYDDVVKDETLNQGRIDIGGTGGKGTSANRREGSLLLPTQGSSDSTTAAYSGFSVDWQLDRGGVKTSVTSWHEIRGNSNKERDVWKMNSWKRQTNDYYFSVAPSVNDPLYGIMFRHDVYGVQTGASSYMRVHSVQPIFRAFRIELEDAAPLTFLNGTPGGQAAADSNATKARLAGSIDDRTTVVFPGDSITVQAQSSEKANLVGFEICVNPNAAVASRTWKRIPVNFVSASGQNGVFTLSKDAIGALRDYITYTGFTGAGGSRYPGMIRIRPLFEKIPVDVTFKNDNQSRANLATSVGGIRQFYIGDKITFSSAILNPSYVSNGVEYDWENGTARGKRQDWYTGGTGGAADSVAVTLTNKKYTFYPNVEMGSNRLAVRVSKTDAAKLDPGYGFLSDPNIIRLDAGNYWDYTIVPEGSISFGELYSISAKLNSTYSSTSSLIWSETMNAQKYTGDVFYIYARDNAADNVVTLTTQNVRQKNVSLKGNVLYEKWDMYRNRAMPGSFMPAVDFVISAGGEMAHADFQASTFSTPEFSVAPNTAVRYLVAANANIFLRENVPGGDRETIVIYPDRSLGSRVEYVNATDPNGFSKANLIELDGKVTTLTATVTDKVPYVNVSGAQVAENITGVTLYVYDRTGIRQKWSSPMVKNPADTQGLTWTATAVFDTDVFLPGDELYISVTTDKNKEFLGISEGIESMPVYTGYTLTKTGYEPPPTINFEPNAWQLDDLSQADRGAFMNALYGEDMDENGWIVVDPEAEPDEPLYNVRVQLGDDGSVSKKALFDDNGNIVKMLSSIERQSSGERSTSSPEFVSMPVIGKLSTGFAIGPVGFRVVQLDNHVTRMEIGVSFAAKDANAKHHTHNTMRSMRLVAYQNFLDTYGLFSLPRNSWGMNDYVRRGGYGGPTFSVGVTFGLYFDFVAIQQTDPNSGELSVQPMLCGGGLMAGVSMSFEYAFQCIVPVVMIPVFFGFGVYADVTAYAGLTIMTPTTLSDFSSGNINAYNVGLSYQLMSMFRVSVFAGVGIARIFAIRAGGSLTVMYLYNPVSLLDNKHGVKFFFSLYIQVDLFITSIPIPVYNWPNFNYGSFAEIQGPRGPANWSLGNMIEDAIKANKEKQSAADDVVLLREFNDEPEQWLVEPPGMIQPFATLIGTGTTPLAENTYDHPEPQIIAYKDAVGTEKMLAVYVGKRDGGSALDVPELRYSVYNGSGGWSEGVPLDPSSDTADYMPKLTDAGDEILITWVSRSDADKTAFTTDFTPVDYSMQMEIWFARFNKANGTFSTPERLTDDEYMDTLPEAVWDAQSGDVIVYYVKNDVAPDGTLVSTADATTNASYVVYRVWDIAAGEWMTTYHAAETEDMDEDEIAEMERDWYGQRFLTAAINEPDMLYTNPNISDFTAIGYDRTPENDKPGIAVYAYTIDKDNDKATGDRELFVQLYDFETRRTYHPIRLTNDDKDDSLPQLVRKGDYTYLFWLYDGSYLKYIDITTLVREGVDANGNLLYEDVPAAESGPEGGELVPDDPSVKRRVVEERFVEVPEIGTRFIEGESQQALASYRAAVDSNGNLYIIWLSSEEIFFEGGGMDSATEIFATALVEKEVDGVVMQTWANPNQLTFSDEDNITHKDEMNIAVGNDGKIFVIHNQYKQSFPDVPDTFDGVGGEDAGVYPVDSSGNPIPALIISEPQLAVTTLEMAGSVKVLDIQMDYPTEFYAQSGETLNVTATVSNTGLTAAYGYKLDVKDSNGTSVKTIERVLDESLLMPGETATETFEWTLPDDIDGLRLVIEAQERRSDGLYYQETKTSRSDALALEPHFVVSNLQTYQDGDEFKAEFTVTNYGNTAAGNDDKLCAEFDRRFGFPSQFGIKNDVFTDIDINGLQPRESRNYVISPDIPFEAFERFGMIGITFMAYGKDGDEDIMYQTAADIIHLAAPRNAVIGDGGNINAVVGTNQTMSVSAAPVTRFTNMNATFTVADETIARFEGNTLIPLKAGTTTVTALTNDFGLLSEPVTLTVTGGGTVNPPWNPGSVTDPSPTPGDTANNVLTNNQPTPASIDEDGTLRLEYSADDIKKYSDGNGEFTITISGHNSISLSIPTTALGSDNLVIKTDFGTLTLSNAVLQKLGDTLRLTIKKGSFTVALVDETGKDIPYNELANPLRLELPYTLGNSQRPEAVIAETGDGIIMPFGVFRNGSIIFDIPATGTYDVKYNLRAFPDIAGHWAIDHINFVGARALYAGNERGEFEPDGSMTRAMFAQVLANIEQVDLSAYKTSRFNDISVEAWYAPAVEWAANKGIVAGYGGRFGPNDLITREQMAVMLINYIKYKGVTLPKGTPAPFADEEEISSWALDSVKAMQAYGIIAGYNNLFSPKDSATRAQVATIFAKHIETAAP